MGKQMITFIDDINTPGFDRYGAQPPIELLRQYMDFHGWYDRKTNTFKNISGMQVVGALQGDGRPVTSRFLRHFNIISVIPFSEPTLKSMYISILDGILRNASSLLQSSIEGIVNSSVELFQAVQAELLPTPTKSHYSFNLRDLFKVFQGIISVPLDCT
jgi:dynein heavy chain